MRGLFVNSPKAQCSIYETSMLYYNTFKLSSKHTLDYEEYSGVDYVPTEGYDFYIIVYHDYVWKNYNIEKLRPYSSKVIGLIFEMRPNQPFVSFPNWFSKYIVVDPTMGCGDNRVYPFPRPIEDFDEVVPYYATDKIVVGTFGLFPSLKKIDKIMDIVKLECKKSLIRINIPYSTYASLQENQSVIDKVRYYCNQKTNPNVEIAITNHYFSMDDLIRWCAQNMCNFFIYDRPNSTGIAACTDQAIASGRPLLVNNDLAFRHIHKYIKPYPEISLKDTLKNGAAAIKQMKADWSKTSVIRAYESMLEQ